MVTSSLFQFKIFDDSIYIMTINIFHLFFRWIGYKSQPVYESTDIFLPIYDWL